MDSVSRRVGRSVDRILPVTSVTHTRRNIWFKRSFGIETVFILYTYLMTCVSLMFSLTPHLVLRDSLFRRRFLRTSTARLINFSFRRVFYIPISRLDTRPSRCDLRVSWGPLRRLFVSGTSCPYRPSGLSVSGPRVALPLCHWLSNFIKTFCRTGNLVKGRVPVVVVL